MPRQSNRLTVKAKSCAIQHRVSTAHDFLQRQAEKMNLDSNREALLRKYAPQVFRAIEEETMYFGA